MKPYLVSVNIGNPPIKKQVFVQAKCPKDAALEAADRLIPSERRFSEVVVVSLQSGMALDYYGNRSHKYYVSLERSVDYITKASNNS